jgi:two-component system cell cycle sensor histidine kinase/response regulator CckA
MSETSPLAVTAEGGALTAVDAEEARRNKELIADAGIGIYFSGPGSRLLSCNIAFARMLGFATVDEAVGVDMSFVYSSQEQREAFFSHLRKHGRLDNFRGPLRRRDGSTIEVISSVVGVFDSDRSLTEVRGFVVDVSASAEKVAALKAGERRFRSVFADATDAMLILDNDRGVVEANRAACALFGLSAGARAGQSLDELLMDEEETVAAAWRELMAVGEARREHRVRSRGGRSRLVECSYRAALQEDRYLCVARDITDRRLVEERLLQSEKIESVGRLAGGIAHDFNNLLTAILGYTELLLDQRAADDPDRPDLEEIRKAGQRAAALTQQLLAFSRKQVLQPKEVDLNQAVSSLQGMLTRLIREDITLTCELARTPAFVKIDPTQLDQVILNLVLNSRDALPDGGSIRLEVACVRLSDSDVPSDQPIRATDYVRLRVVDDGVGIAPEVRAHLFEPFFTTKEPGKGTGLGLASVYGIVRQSNGFIAVASEPGLGTAFTMHFPAVGAAASLEKPAIGPGAMAGGGETILLVEDEDAVRVIVGATLRRHGYDVIEVATPHGACEVFEQLGSSIDLLMTDVVMPEMNGPALAQRLVAERPELRVLFISGYANVPSFDAGNPNVSFLSKPFQSSALAAKVREVLTRPRH